MRYRLQAEVRSMMNLGKVVVAASFTAKQCPRCVDCSLDLTGSRRSVENIHFCRWSNVSGLMT